MEDPLINDIIVKPPQKRHRLTRDRFQIAPQNKKLIRIPECRVRRSSPSHQSSAYISTQRTQKQRAALKESIINIEKLLLVICSPIVVYGTIGFSKNLAIGEAIIATYAISVVIFKIPSRITFWFVSLFLVSIPAVLLLVPDAQRSKNTSIYAFLVLGVAIFNMVLETYRLAAGRKRYR